MWDWVCAWMCVCTSVCTFSGLRQSYAAASWLSLKLSGLAYLPCQLHSLWQPDDMGLCDGHDPPDVPLAPTPHPPSRPPSSQSAWASGVRNRLTQFLGVFFLRLRTRWLSTKVVLEGTVSSSGYGNNYLLNMNKTVIAKHDPLHKEYSTIFWFFFSWIQMTNGHVRRCALSLLRIYWRSPDFVWNRRNITILCTKYKHLK